MNKTLDSSERFNQSKYKGRIKEVAVSGAPVHSGDLEDMTIFVLREGYYFEDMRILNLVHGSPSENEPVEAILVGRGQGGSYEQGLIIKKNQPAESEAQYYFRDNFRFIP